MVSFGGASICGRGLELVMFELLSLDKETKIP